MAKETTPKTISRSLQETVTEHYGINEVHFSKNGHHYFNVHKYEGKTSLEKKDDGLYGRIRRQWVQDSKTGVEFEIITPIPETKIVETLTREQVLSATPTSDLLLTASALGSLSAKEMEVINKMRQTA